MPRATRASPLSPQGHRAIERDNVPPESAPGNIAAPPYPTAEPATEEIRVRLPHPVRSPVAADVAAPQGGRKPALALSRVSRSFSSPSRFDGRDVGAKVVEKVTL
jgi:hypothetical protein